MFPRGPRFPAVKLPEVPGPNAYNPQDPEYDAYKRGAFLEKTNRFAKEEPSDAPGPGTYNADATTTARAKSHTSNTKSATDRYAVLQRKLEDLERMHAEGKKAHLMELERLKAEISRSQRSCGEQTERADKLKKQNDVLDARVQELKKSSAADQSELRELRSKLKVAEHERAQLSAKQGEAGDVKRALQAAEAKRKEDLRERDKKLADLEKALAMEKKRRDAAEARLADVKGKVDGEVERTRAIASDLETQLQAARSEAEGLKTNLRDVKTKATDRQDDLLTRLEQHRLLLTRVADEYGRLASTTVPKAVHNRTQDQATALQLRVIRLERKLANADGQVVELASLVRHTKEENTLLSARLHEVDEEVAFYSALSRDITREVRENLSTISEFQSQVHDTGKQLWEDRLDVQQAAEAQSRDWAEIFRLRCEILLGHSSIILRGIDDADIQRQQHTSRLSELETERMMMQRSLEELLVKQGTSEQQLMESTTALGQCEAAKVALQEELEKMRNQTQSEASRFQQMLQKERDANKRLAEVVQKHRVGEETLQAELEQLTAELAHAERFEEAYTNLVDEVDALIARNSLAEEEAAHLSKFNAEIVGHNNPAQRIMYVDRIRRELHETKQKLLVSTREQENMQAHFEELQRELALYKSVAVPPELKPRTAVTRIERLSVQTRVRPASDINDPIDARSAGTGTRRLQPVIESSCDDGEMTLDEIM